jgi:hypothetical protein
MSCDPHVEALTPKCRYGDGGINLTIPLEAVHVLTIANVIKKVLGFHIFGESH